MMPVRGFVTDDTKKKKEVEIHIPSVTPLVETFLALSMMLWDNGDGEKVERRPNNQISSYLMTRIAIDMLLKVSQHLWEQRKNKKVKVITLQTDGCVIHH